MAKLENNPTRVRVAGGLFVVRRADGCRSVACVREDLSVACGVVWFLGVPHCSGGSQRELGL